MAYTGAWRVADSLDKLLAQINAAAPRRSKASDGSIADDEHEKSSDHYPKVLPGLGSTPTVTARDFTHDPGDGADMAEIAEALRRSRDRRIAYVIFNRRIFSATVQPWVWRPYSGKNPHDKHMHVSVVHSALADDDNPWEIGDEMTPEQEKQLRDLAWQVGNVPSPDGQRRILTGAVGLVVERLLVAEKTIANLAAASPLTEEQWQQVKAAAEAEAREEVADLLRDLADVAEDPPA